MMQADEEHLCCEAQAALDKGDLHLAADKCKALLVQFPRSARGYHLTASVFSAIGNFRKARDYSSIAAGLDDCVVAYHLQQGEVLFTLKEYEEAQAAFARVIARSPQHGEARRWLAKCAVALERFDEARDWLVQARQAEPDMDTRLEEADCAWQAGDAEGSESTLMAYIHDYPHRPEALVALAKQWVAAGDIDRAEPLFVRALSVDPGHTQANFYRALLYAESGQEREAIRHFLCALQHAPTHIPSLLMLGVIFLKEGDLESSEKAFTHVLALCPEHVLAWHSILEIMQQTGCLREGLKRLGEVLRCLPKPHPLSHLCTLFSGDVPPVASRNFVMAIYQSYLELFEPWVIAASNGPHVQALAEELARLPVVAEKRYVSLLDLGCGTGELVRHLQDVAAISVGVDITSGMVKIAKRHGGYDVLYDLDIMDYISCSEATFDLVAATGALRWLGNLQPFFQAVRNVMHEQSVLGFMLDKERSTLAYSVSNDGRYSHHYAYVTDIAASEGFELLRHRTFEWGQGPEQVVRHMFFFKKMTVH